jgi:hypothetical protein
MKRTSKSTARSRASAAAADIAFRPAYGRAQAAQNSSSHLREIDLDLTPDPRGSGGECVDFVEAKATAGNAAPRCYRDRCLEECRSRHIGDVEHAHSACVDIDVLDCRDCSGCSFRLDVLGDRTDDVQAAPDVGTSSPGQSSRIAGLTPRTVTFRAIAGICRQRHYAIMRN